MKNILFIGSFSNTVNIFKTQLEIIALLKNKGLQVFVTGNFTEEVQGYLLDKEIEHYHLFPKKKIDKSFSAAIEKILVAKKIDIVQFFSGKASRSVLFYHKKNTIKFVSFMGSISLHWYDPTSYLTFLHRKIDRIICVSKFVAAHVTNQLPKKNKHKVVQIYEGYSSDWFKETKRFDYTSLKIPKEATVVCFVGNHRKVKGTQYFITSSYHLNSKENIHYIVIGGKTDTKEFKKLAKNSPIKDKIHFLGFKKNAVDYIKGATIYVQTSLSEGLCRAICEAMSVEKPIIMTNAGGCTELIDKKSGIICPLKDEKAIGEAISFLADSKNLQTEMGQVAKKRIDTLFNIQKTADDFFNLYQAL